MGRYWWLTWLKVIALLIVFAVLFTLGYRKMEKALSGYLIDAPEDAKFYERIDLEQLVFDYASDFVDRMEQESEESRTAISESLR